MRVAGRLGSRPPAVVAGLLAAAVTAVLIGAPAAQAAQRPYPAQRPLASHPSGPAGVGAPWAELANAATGSPLWSRDPLAERPMGSITKVMTAYIVIEDSGPGGLNRVLTVPKGIIAYDDKYDASTAGLVPGEKLTVTQLLYAMLIPSGCDAAYTLAYAYGPGRDKFVAKMNATARELGLTKTVFSDFSGLPDPGEYTTYSTTGDLIRLGLDAMKLPLFRQIVALQRYHLAAGDGHRAHTWLTTNLLLKAYPGAFGIKTGQTSAAGFCLLFEARRDGKTLIGVVLHSSVVAMSYAVSDAEKMLNWGFARRPAG